MKHFTEGLYYTRAREERHTFGRRDPGREDDMMAGNDEDGNVLTRNIVFMELQP